MQASYTTLGLIFLSLSACSSDFVGNGNSSKQGFNGSARQANLDGSADESTDSSTSTETATSTSTSTDTNTGTVTTTDGSTGRQYAFLLALPKTATRSRESFSTLCQDAATAAGKTGTFKALISLTSKYPLAAADQPIGKLNANEYISIKHAVYNMKDELVANDAAEFWSPNHKALMVSLPGKNDGYVGSTGSTAAGVYADTCASDDPGGAYRSCNCRNLQAADGGHGYRFVGGNSGWTVGNGTANSNWAFLMTAKEGQTVCTFNHSKYAPSPIYCVQSVE